MRRSCSPAGLIASNSVSIIVTNATTNAAFYYTLNGSEPTASSTPIIGGAFTLATTNSGVKIKAFKNGYANSVTIGAAFSFVVADPDVSVKGGVFNNDVTVGLSSSTTNAVIYWTTNGVAPTPSTGVAGTNVIITQNCSLQARAYRAGFIDSAIVTYVFNLAASVPGLTPSGATNNNVVPITAISATTNSTIVWILDDGLGRRATNTTANGASWTVQTNGTLTVQAVRPGYDPSPLFVVPVSLTVDAPRFVASTTSSNDTIAVMLTNATAGSTIYWALNGVPTTSGSWVTNGGTIVVNKDGTLQAFATLPGFISSQTASQIFTLKVNDPQILPNGATGNNPVLVTVTNQSVGNYSYSYDGGATWQPYTGPFVVATNATLSVRGQTNGFADSATVAASFTLTVGPILLTNHSAANPAINSNVIAIAYMTTNALIHVTMAAMDGSATTTSDFVNVSPGNPFYITNIDNEVINVKASYLQLTPALAGPLTFQVQVPAPSMSPSNGYFPSGAIVRLACARANASIYYTVNGQNPTANDLLYNALTGIDLNSVQFPKSDLRIIKAAAFAPNTIPSAVTSGQSLATNSMSVASAVIGGQGATIILPVVINMQTNQTLRSLQFNLEISPQAGGAAPNTGTPLQALVLSANDYVQVAGNSAAGYTASFSTSTYTNGTTNGISFYSLATNLLITDFGVLANVMVKIPGTSPVGSTYLVNLTDITGTSDAQQHGVALTSAPGTITVANSVYLAGDCSPGRWYNAGDFGGGALDNADVNAAFQASLGIFTPYPGSDVFNAMDVYPESGGNSSGAGGIVGDGLITYLDWQHILLRSLGRETNSWKRWWQDGTLHHLRINGPTLGSARQSAPAAAVAPSVDLWLRHALIWGTVITNAVPGNAYSMPVYAKVLLSFSINGMQLRAVMTSQGSAPAPGSVQFVSTDTLGQPSTMFQNAPNDVAVAWSLGRPVDPMISSNLIGYVNFSVPATAQQGQYYTIELKYPQGAVDLDTELQLESAAGQVWVLSAPANPLLHIVSDQWRTNFFGNLTNPNGDPEADPDHDGVPNWMEYQAGTNPTNAASHLGFASAAKPPGFHGVTLNWAAMTGRVYVLETRPSLTSGGWTAVSTNIIGNGTINSFTTTNAPGNAGFYRIKLMGQ